MADAEEPGNAEEPGPTGMEGLDARDRTILRTLVPDEEGRVAFQGLRRRLDVHQQSLARTLQRLQRYDLVAQDEGGYFLTAEGERALGGPEGVHPRSDDAVPLVEGLLPPGLDAEAVLDHLAGRWFEGLRWYGWTATPGETSLTWLGEPRRTLLRLRVSDDAFLIEVTSDDAGEAPPDPDAFHGARVLLRSLAELFGMPRDRDRGPDALWTRRGMAG